MFIFLFECLFVSYRKKGEKRELKFLKQLWLDFSCMNLLAFEHNLNYLEMWSCPSVCMLVFSPYIMCDSWLEVVCFLNATNHILRFYLWSFSLSVALAWHLIAFSTLPLPLKEKNCLHANHSCKTRIRLRHSSNGTHEPLQITLDEFSVP